MSRLSIVGKSMMRRLSEKLVSWLVESSMKLMSYLP